MNRLWSTARGELAIRTGGLREIITAPFSRGNGGLSVPLMNFEKITEEVSIEQAGGAARFFWDFALTKKVGGLAAVGVGGLGKLCRLRKI